MRVPRPLTKKEAQKEFLALLTGIEPFVRTVSESLFTFYWSFSPGNSGTVQSTRSDFRTDIVCSRAGPLVEKSLTRRCYESAVDA